MDRDVDDELVGEKVDLKGQHNSELCKSVTEMKQMYINLRKEMKLQKGSNAKRGEEMDKEKYMTLISEYKRFKMSNVQHFRFNSAANSTNFGKFQSKF